jgi:hypothetical protein
VRKPGPTKRNRLVEACGCVVLDELDRAAAGEERVDDVRLERSDLGQERLELDLRKRQRQLLDDLAAALFERFLEAARRLLARGVLPGDRDRGLLFLLGHHLAHRKARLRIGERHAEHVRAHSGPVISSAPALGMMSSVLLSRATLDIASATPECTVPTSTSTWSRLTSLFALSGAFAGSDSSSTVKYSISRPRSFRRSRRPRA